MYTYTHTHTHWNFWYGCMQKSSWQWHVCVSVCLWVFVSVWCMSMSFCTHVIQDIQDTVLLWPWPSRPITVTYERLLVDGGRWPDTEHQFYVTHMHSMAYALFPFNRKPSKKWQNGEQQNRVWVQQTKDSFESEKEVASVWDCDHVARICVSGVRLEMATDDPRWPRQQQWPTVKRQPPFWSLTPTSRHDLINTQQQKQSGKWQTQFFHYFLQHFTFFPSCLAEQWQIFLCPLKEIVFRMFNHQWNSAEQYKEKYFFHCSGKFLFNSYLIGEEG